MTRTYFEIALEDAEGIESTTYDSREVAVRAFAKEAQRLRRGQHLTLNHVTVLDEAGGEE